MLPIHTFILETVNNNSGGIKFSELVRKVTAWSIENGLKPIDSNDLEVLVKEIPELKTLEYHWRMFVYRRTNNE